MRLILHVLLNLLSRGFEFIHYALRPLFGLKFFILPSGILQCLVRFSLILLIIECLLHFLFHCLYLLLDFLKVTEECLLVRHPFLKSAFT